MDVEDLFELRQKMERIASLPPLINGPNYASLLRTLKPYVAHDQFLHWIKWRPGPSSGKTTLSTADIYKTGAPNIQAVVVGVFDKDVVLPSTEFIILSDGSLFCHDLNFSIRKPDIEPFQSDFDIAVRNALALQGMVASSGRAVNFVTNVDDNFAFKFKSPSFSRRPYGPWDPSSGHFALKGWDLPSSAKLAYGRANLDSHFTGLVAYDRTASRIKAGKLASKLPGTVVEVRFTLEHFHANVGTRHERDIFTAIAQQVTILKDDEYPLPIVIDNGPSDYAQSWYSFEAMVARKEFQDLTLSDLEWDDCELAKETDTLSDTASESSHK